MTAAIEQIEQTITSTEETQAENLIQHGEIDQAIAIYQNLKPHSGRILHLLGVIYAEKKGDQQSAIHYFQQALQIKQEVGDDITDTLTGLAWAYNNLRDFDSALIYHLRSLTLRESNPNADQKQIVRNLLGLANACWGQEDLSQALIYAQRALTLNRSLLSSDHQQVAANLAILANIYHHAGDDIRALELAKQALATLENSSQSDLSSLVTVLNNIGAIQFSAGLFDDALSTFVRVMHIYEGMLPKDHQKRLAIEQNIRRMTEIQENNLMSIFPNLWNMFTKLSLF